MVLKFGTTEIPNTATVNYVDGNGSHPVSAIVYNGTTVWQAGPGMSTQLDITKTPILFHFDNNYWTYQNNGNLTQDQLAKYNFPTSVGSYPVPKFNSYGYTQWQQSSAGYFLFGGLSLTTTDNFTVECWVYPAANGYYGNTCANHYAGIVFVDSNGDTTGAATVTPIWRMYVKCTTDLYHAVLTVSDDDQISFTSSEVTSANGWYHIAAVHKGSGVFDFFINGQKVTTQTISFTSSTGFNFECLAHGPTNTSDNAYFDEVVVHSYARYTGNFTPPTQAYTVV